MAKRIADKSRWHKQVQFAAAVLIASTSCAVTAADWRMVIASEDVVVMVDAGTFRRDGQQLTFRSAAYPPAADADGSIGNVADFTFDCAARRMKTEQVRDIRADGSTVETVVTAADPKGFVAIAPKSVAALFLDRMCGIKTNGNKMDGVVVSVPPEMAAKSVFGLLKLGLDSRQASDLATQKYWDEGSLLSWLEAAAVPKAKRAQVRKVLAAQSVQAPPPPAPIVPLASAVGTGKVGKYTHSAQELVAGLWLRADGTFRYGLTVGSLDETAAGRWTATGNQILLTNEPRPMAPTITAGPGNLTPGTPLTLQLRTSAGKAVQGVGFTVEFDTGAPLESYMQSASWSLPDSEQRQPRAVTFAWPSYGLRPMRFAMNPKTANNLTFVFNPNDFGVVDLTGLRVDAGKDSLTLHRDGTTMRFTKANP